MESQAKSTGTNLTNAPDGTHTHSQCGNVPGTEKGTLGQAASHGSRAVACVVGDPRLGQLSLLLTGSLSAIPRLVCLTP